MVFDVKARRPGRGAGGPADRARVRCSEDTLVGAAVAIYALFPVVALTLLWLADLHDTPATGSAVVLLCLTQLLAGVGAVIALVVRLFCFLIESIG